MSPGWINAHFSNNLMVILKESLKQNLCKNIVAMNRTRALATPQMVVTIKIKGGPTRTKM